MQIRHYLSTDRMIRFSQRAALMGFALIAVQSAQAAPICAPAAGARSVPACMAEVNSRGRCPVISDKPPALPNRFQTGTIESAAAERQRLDVVPVSTLLAQQNAQKLTDQEVQRPRPRQNHVRITCSWPTTTLARPTPISPRSSSISG